MFETLTERLRRVETGLREIEGCTATQVDVANATRLVGEFWTGEQFTYDNLSATVRTDPIVRSERRATNES